MTAKRPGPGGSNTLEPSTLATALCPTHTKHSLPPRSPLEADRRQRAFAKGLHEGLSGRKAAVAAGYATPSDAKRLRKHPTVIAELARLRAMAAPAAQDGRQQAAAPAPMPTPTQAAPSPQVPANVAEPGRLTPLDYLLQVMRDPGEPTAVRVMAAKTAAPFVHAKLGESDKPGKRHETAEKAKAVGSAGLFSAGQPPRLVANNSKG